MSRRQISHAAECVCLTLAGVSCTADPREHQEGRLYVCLCVRVCLCSVSQLHQAVMTPCLWALAASVYLRQQHKAKIGNTWREKKNSITWPVCSKMCLTGHFDNVGSRFPSPSLSDPLLCHTHTLSLSLSYFLPPTSITICILMNLGAVSSRSVIPTSCFSLSSCFYILIFFFCALLLLTPHPFLPVSISQKKPMLTVRGLNNTISLRAVPNM